MTKSVRPSQMAWMRKAKKSKRKFNFSEFQERAISPFSHRSVVVGIIMIVLVIGGIAIANSRVFHSTVPNPAYHGNDPDVVTPIWTATDPNGNGNEFNYNALAVQGSPSLWAGNTAIELAPNGTASKGYAVALAKNSFDPSIISGKHFKFIVYWKAVNINSWPNDKRVVMFLTRNSTLPIEPGYNPFSDSNVALIMATSPSGTNFNHLIMIQRNAGDTITSEDFGCNSGASCFIGQTMTNVNFAPSSNVVQWSFWLNFTGHSGPVGSACAASGTFPQGGSGCSVMIDTNANSINPQTGVGVNTLPGFLFQGQRYFMGFWADSGITSGGGAFDFGFSNNMGAAPLQVDPTGSGVASGSMQVGAAQIISTPVNVSPTIDTGGFFGPLLNALGNAFAIAGKILFSVANFIWSGIVVGLDTFGNFIGMGAVGTDLSNFLGTFFAFITNVFANFLAWTANGTSLIGNAFTALATLLTVYFAQVGAFFSGVVGFLSLFVTVLSDVLQYGKYPVSFIISLWWVWGIYEAYDGGLPGFLGWVNMSEGIMFRGLNVIIWFSEQSVKMIYRIRGILPHPV